MQRPAMRVDPVTTTSSSGSSSSVCSSSISSRDLLSQRQPAVCAATPTAMLSSTQQISVSVSFAGTEQPLQEPLEQHRSKELRKEVSRLKLKVNRHGGPEGNDHKRGYIALIREHHRGSSRQREHSHAVANTIANSGRDSQDRATAGGVRTGDLTIRLLDTLFSEQFWRTFYNLHHTIAQRNKSMLSHTATIPSIDMYSPLQSSESLKFWEEIASALRGSFNAGGGSITSCTPAKLFDCWRHLCAAFNGKATERTTNLAQELVYLDQLLKRRPALASLVSVGSFYSTFAATVPAGVPQVPSQTPVAVPHMPEPATIPDDDDDDDLAFITDDDMGNDISQESAAQPVAISADRSAALSQQRERSTAGPDSELAILQRAFWRSKQELVLQNIANAKLQFDIMQTAFVEEQLCGSKRKVQALQDELRKADRSSSAAKEIGEELAFYVREKRRMLDALIRRGQQGHVRALHDAF